MRASLFLSLFSLSSSISFPLSLSVRAFLFIYLFLSLFYLFPLFVSFCLSNRCLLPTFFALQVKILCWF
uniref:Uncharacterized protein n=1 Tax=Rhipicephalus pulchellus TaxID=72859 RepID=L7LUL7_RHIPC